ncbi:hypothetical protein Ddc_17086 [Ditylenchus destructor]|nr:hypothetical protein Ddc_17086 [Ditylenchus destructor]
MGFAQRLGTPGHAWGTPRPLYGFWGGGRGGADETGDYNSAIEAGIRATEPVRTFLNFLASEARSVGGAADGRDSTKLNGSRRWHAANAAFFD